MNKSALETRLIEQVGNRFITTSQLPQEEINLVCREFDTEVIKELIIEQIPYPSDDPNNDLVYKLRVILERMNFEKMVGE